MIRAVLAIAAWLGSLTVSPTPALAADTRPRVLPGTRAEAATLIVQGVEGGSLPFAAIASSDQAVTDEGADGSTRVRLPIVFEVPGTGLPEAVAAAAALEFYVYAFTPTGSVVAHLGMAVDLEPAQLPGQTGLKVITSLDLPPGSYSLRFLVLEPVSHRFGLRLLDLSLPGDGEPVTLSRPSVVDSCADWLVARASDAPRVNRAALPILPIDSRNSLRTSFLGDSAPDLDGGWTATVHLSPTSGERDEPHSITAGWLGGEPDRRLEIAFELPSIGRGVYRLSVELGSAATSLASPAIDAWVVDVADLGAPSDPCARTWSGVIANSSSRGGAPVASPQGMISQDTPPGPEGRAERVRLRRAYLQVLDHLAAGADLGAAAEALCAVEAARPNLRANLQALLRNELEVAKRLAEKQPESLPVLMRLHHDAYLEHRSREQFPLAGHSTRAVRALAELIVDRHLPQESQALAADILTSLAEIGHRNRMLIPSQLALQDAVAMDPGNREALVLLAVNYEWFGRYAEAARLLERLVEEAAIDTEARLRLGIMRRRLGKTEEAERDLRRVVREGAPPWVLSLAYQALAGLLHEQKRHEEAVDLLRASRSRLESDQRIHVLSAHALDRTGRPSEARRLLAGLPIEGTGRTPRFRYGDSLTSDLVSLRARVDQGVAVRLPLLRRALEEKAD